jgi:excisionase family DNA binding protein
MGPKNRRPLMPTPTRDAALLDVDTVAQALAVRRRHVQRLVSERRIPFIKVGRFVRFDPASLNVWLDGRRVEPERETPPRVRTLAIASWVLQVAWSPSCGLRRRSPSQLEL